MPLGKYKDFAACHGAKMREGLSDAAASRYCGALQQQIEGASSQVQKDSASYNNMSAQEMEGKDKPEGDTQRVSFSESEMTQLVQTAADEGATKTLALLKEKVDIEEEGPGPAGPPTKKPPFM
jgi:hypothetical protein